MNLKSNALIPFYRYNVVAVIATAVDFLVLVVLTEFLGLWYFFSAIIGAITGGITSFLLERNWAFMKKNKKLSTQAMKYIVVWITSIILNTIGLYILVEYSDIQYIFAKIIVSILIGIGFNFFTHKYYIFN